MKSYFALPQILVIGNISVFTFTSDYTKIKFTALKTKRHYVIVTCLIHCLLTSHLEEKIALLG